MRNYLAAFVAASLALTACTPSEDEETTDATTIHHFAITGTNGVTSGGTAMPAINPYQNGGVFELDWDVSSSTRPHRIEWYVSRNDSLDGSDKMFLGRNCDQQFGDCQTQANTFACSFSTSSVIQCSTASTDAYNMTSYFAANGGLPNTYYVILRACDGLFDDCRTRTAAVLFQ